MAIITAIGHFVQDLKDFNQQRACQDEDVRRHGREWLKSIGRRAIRSLSPRKRFPPIWASTFINQPSGRAVTRPSHLPWSSGDDFRLSLTPISAGDRGSIPRGRDFFFCSFFFVQTCLDYVFLFWKKITEVD
ncbi:hypothetical protein ACN38_g5183 [Penicillium nordicum]|uniref:Uncharacterized protein n=1 Tax=Penicillium nordicum TaxID=229535 RepID=A0A0M8P5G3_9EURO|nr:hypothetical protein ACN38_g5183 [Penicillium nordicum]